MIARPGPTAKFEVLRVGAESKRSFDEVIGEEPLEIRLQESGSTRSLFVTMRTPGADFDLVLGWLLHEGVIESASEVAELRYCTDASIAPEERFNVVLVRLRGAACLRAPLSRTTFASSACGVCGTSQLSGISLRRPPLGSEVRMRRSILVDLPNRLRGGQRLFDRTGGVHGAALVDDKGEILALREDVGRHNAVDKVVGAQLSSGGLSRAAVLMVSGRLGYEIVQKALFAGVPIVASISAPSSLAVEVGSSLGLTLVGFLRGETFNIYSHPERIEMS